MPDRNSRSTGKAKSTKLKQPTPRDQRRYAPDVKAILNECAAEVTTGLGGKTLGAKADAQLRTYFGTRILKRLANGGDWAKEKHNPLVVARHLGEVCAIMTKGGTVSPTVALAAAAAVKQDEYCTRGGGGAGNWCF